MTEFFMETASLGDRDKPLTQSYKPNPKHGCSKDPMFSPTQASRHSVTEGQTDNPKVIPVSLPMQATQKSISEDYTLLLSKYKSTLLIL